MISDRVVNHEKYFSFLIARLTVSLTCYNKLILVQARLINNSSPTQIEHGRTKDF